jgi:hypothetical protein
MPTPSEQIRSTFPADDALPGAMSVIQDASRNETSRFNNLNSRGVAVLSATSLVTALAGLYAKNILGGTFTGWVKLTGLIGLVFTLVFLAAVALIIVIGVLLPRYRSLFGGNTLTDHPEMIKDSKSMQRLVFDEYRRVYVDLVQRNQEKAKALTRAYFAFLVAVIAIAATIAIISIGKY